jgi:tungstate transport system ATP-binding protein
MDNAYELRDIRCGWKARCVLALDELDIPRGRVVGLCGGNGTGKSTLLALLAFLLVPDAGRVAFWGRRVQEPSRARRRVTLLPQDPYLLKRSVADNVAYGLKVRGETEGVAQRVGAALEQVGLDPVRFGGRPWFELSGGEARRVALASRLVLRTPVLLLDEPTASLDRASTRLVKEAVELAAGSRRQTLVVSSHDLGWLESVAGTVLDMETKNKALQGAVT